MEQDPTRICELLVGLGDVNVVGVDDEATEPLVVHIQTRTRSRPVCSGCGGLVRSKGTRPVRLVDLPVFGRPVRLVWHKHRWFCPATDCATGSFTETNDEIAPTRSALTTRAGRWATTAVGRDARAVSDVAAELGCDWHTVNKAVLCWGEALLAADVERVGAVSALGLDETLFGREGRWRTRRWCTSIVDVCGGQLLDVVAGRDAQAPIRWLLDQPQAWRDGITWGTLDLSGAYRRTFDVALPNAGQVADPFHVIRLGNNSVDETRRRVQNDTLGHRGRKHDPLYRVRRLLMNVSAKVPTPNSAVCSPQATPKARFVWRGTPKKPCAASTTSTAPNSLTAICVNSPTTSPTVTVHRAVPVGPHPASLASPDHQLAPRTGHQRPYRIREQSHQTRQTGCLRVPTIHQLPDPGAALRRETHACQD